MASWDLRRVAVVGLLVFLFGVLAVDAFGPADFSPTVYVAPSLLALGGLFADILIKPKNGHGNGKAVENGGSGTS